MRIAQIAPPMESVPPAYYGGTERVVSYLTEELVRTRSSGHSIRQRGLANLGRACLLHTRRASTYADSAGPDSLLPAYAR